MVFIVVLVPEVSISYDLIIKNKIYTSKSEISTTCNMMVITVYSPKMKVRILFLFSTMLTPLHILINKGQLRLAIVNMLKQ